MKAAFCKLYMVMLSTNLDISLDMFKTSMATLMVDSHAIKLTIRKISLGKMLLLSCSQHL